MTVDIEINGDRLSQRLDDFARIGGTPAGGANTISGYLELIGHIPHRPRLRGGPGQLRRRPDLTSKR